MSSQQVKNSFELIVSAPSGAGKTTLLKKLQEHMSLKKVVSYTTRDKRDSETDGLDYHFVNRLDFMDKVQNNFFLEWADVYGNLYGTPKQLDDESVDFIIYEVDVKGFFSLQKHKPDVTSIFILPPSLSSLKERLLTRQPDMPEPELNRRLSSALEEIQYSSHYNYTVCNDNLSEALESLMLIFKCEKIRTVNNKEFIQKFSH